MSTEKTQQREGRGAARDQGPQDRRLQRRHLASDRQGRRRHLEARRGAGADRRIRRRQVDASALPPWALPGRAAASPAARLSSTASTCAPPARTNSASLRARASAYVAQSAAASFNPAHSLHRPDDRDGAGSSHHGPRPRPTPMRVDLYGRLQLAQSRHDRQSLSPPGLRRPVAARHDRHGDVLPARPHHLRRADDGARRHHAGRGAGCHPRHRRAVQHRRDLHHP